MSETPLTQRSWARAHAVDLAVGLLAVGWLAYILWITREFSFWSDDLFLLEQSGSWRGLFDSYNDHLSVTILSVYRASAELASLSYTPFMVAGALSLLVVPVGYYATTRARFGPPLTALLTLPLLWYDGMSLRPALLNHHLALAGAVICAAALNQGRRADGLLAAALLVSLLSAGGDVVVSRGADASSGSGSDENDARTRATSTTPRPICAQRGHERYFLQARFWQPRIILRWSGGLGGF